MHAMAALPSSLSITVPSSLLPDLACDVGNVEMMLLSQARSKVRKAQLAARQALPLMRQSGGTGGTTFKAKSSWLLERERLMAEWGDYALSGLVLADG